MSTPQCLMRNRHGSAWYARIHIPRHLRPLLNGRTEVRKSSGTTDKRQASRFAVLFWAECQAFFGLLEQSMGRKKSADNNSLRVGLTTGQDVFGREFKFDFGGDKNPEAAKLEMQALQQVQAESRSTLELLKHSPETLAAILTSNGPKPQAQAQERDLPESTMTWEQLYAAYEQAELARAGDPTHRLTLKTHNDYKGYRELWREYFSGRDVHTIKRKDITDIEAWLKRLPAGFTKKQMSPASAIAMAISGNHNHPIVAAATYNHYQRQLAGLLKYAHRIGAHNNDLSSSIAQINAKLGKKIVRHPFTIEDLTMIFCGERYISNFGEGHLKTPFPARFWIPLIAVFSGARLDEISQLKVSDVRYDESADCHYLNIAGKEDNAPDGKPKHVKNRNSIRPIPIHASLVTIGFLRYWANLLDQGDPEASLFGLARAPDGKWGSPVTKWFSNKSSGSKGFIERCGVTSQGNATGGLSWSKSFHGFRHTVIDNLRDRQKCLPNGSRIAEEDIGLVVGHLSDENSKLETRNYGHGDRNLLFRKEVIALIHYPGVDFESIAWPHSALHG